MAPSVAHNAYPITVVSSLASITTTSARVADVALRNRSRVHAESSSSHRAKSSTDPSASSRVNTSNRTRPSRVRIDPHRDAATRVVPRVVLRAVVGVKSVFAFTKKVRCALTFVIIITTRFVSFRYGVKGAGKRARSDG